MKIQIVFLFAICFSLILLPLDHAEARAKKASRHVALAKAAKASNKTSKKTASIKKKKSKLAKKQKKQLHKSIAKTKKLPAKVGTKYTTAEVIAPELEIVMPEGDFHTDYEAHSGTMEMSSQQPAEEFQKNEVSN